MDDGRLTGATGNVVDFTNVVLLMTSQLRVRQGGRREEDWVWRLKQRKGEQNKAVNKSIYA